MKLSITMSIDERKALLHSTRNHQAVVSSNGDVQTYSSLSDGNGSHIESVTPRTLCPSPSRRVVLVVSTASLILLLVQLFYLQCTNHMIRLPILQLSHQNLRYDATEVSPEKQQSMLEGAFSTITNEPLSYKSPAELGIPVYNNRPDYSRPGSVFGSVQKGAQIGVPLPTNEWYLNLIIGLDDSPGDNNSYDNFAGAENRVYTIPYIVDTVGTIVGIRLHYPNVISYGTVVQSVFVAWHGLTLGTADEGFTRRFKVDEETLPSKLGIGIRWEKDGSKQSQQYIRSRILRGMPYGTMEYAAGVNPAISSEIVANSPFVDGFNELQCGTLDPHNNEVPEEGAGILAKHDVVRLLFTSECNIRLMVILLTTSLIFQRIDLLSLQEIFFQESDFTWLVFFSRPVYVRCYINPSKEVGTISLPPGAASSQDNPNAFQLRLEPFESTDESLIVRVALANNCTRGTNVNFCNMNQARDQSDFMSVLREHAEVYPTSPTVKYAFSDPGNSRDLGVIICVFHSTLCNAYSLFLGTEIRGRSHTRNA